MCSSIFLIKYAFCMFATLILLVVAVVTPRWHENVFLVSENKTGSDGFFRQCITMGGQTCTEEIQSWPDWKEAAFVITMMTFGTTFFGLIWAVVAAIGACCKNYLFQPLASVAAVSFIFSVITPILFAIYMPSGGNVGFSMVCAIVASGLLFLAVLTGICAVRCSGIRAKSVKIRPRWQTETTM